MGNDMLRGEEFDLCLHPIQYTTHLALKLPFGSFQVLDQEILPRQLSMIGVMVDLSRTYRGTHDPYHRYENMLNS